jgi:hypothetical protein
LPDQQAEFTASGPGFKAAPSSFGEVSQEFLDERRRMREELEQKNSRIYASSDEDDERRARESQVRETLKNYVTLRFVERDKFMFSLSVTPPHSPESCHDLVEQLRRVLQQRNKRDGDGEDDNKVIFITTFGQGIRAPRKIS